MKKFLLVLMAGFLLTACSSVGSKNNREAYNYNYAGTLEVLEMSSWMYGSHTLTTKDGEFYALKSENVDLNDFNGRSVHLLGDEVDGYPLNNGPKLIDVKKVQLMEK